MKQNLYSILMGTRGKKCRNIVQFILVLVSLFAICYVFVNAPVREGLEMMWLIPAAFLVNVCLFGRILDYGVGTLGLRVFYVIILIRYIISPILITMVDGKVDFIRMSNLPASVYHVAIIIQIIELFICVITIYFYYPRLVIKHLSKEEAPMEKIDSGIHLGGYFVLFVIAIVLLIRFPIWFPALQIYGIKQATSYGIVLDGSLFSCIKTSLFVISLSKTVKSKGTKKFWGSLFITIFCAILCLVTTFGSNRSFTLELFATIIVLLSYYLPKYKTVIMICLVPLSMIVIFSMIVTKQFSLETASQFSQVSFDLQYISNQLEEYTNGLWCIAQSYSASIGLTFTQRFQAIIKELADALIAPLEMPGFKGLFDFSKDWVSTASIMKYSFQNYDRGQMLSFSAGYFINFGVIGWILFPIANCLAMILLVRFSVEYHFSKTILEKFMYLWSTFLFGLTLCYCTQTLIYCMSKYIFFLWIIKQASKMRIKI